MPLKILTGAEAIANLRSNPFAEWPARGTEDMNRIEPLCRPAFAPSFRFEPREKVFTMGSCFARNVERELAARGFDVVTSQLAWPDKNIDMMGNSVLNNYGVASIENELNWALDPARPFDPEKHIFEVAAGRFVDPHIQVRPVPREKVLAYRKAMTDVTRRVVECRVVIMTLGLSELWFDRETGTYLNRSPPRMLVARYADRFELHLLDFHDTLRSLEASFALLKRYSRPDQRVLLTVSPVPLGTTHTTGDVLVVNSYSKAVLRTAAEHIATTHENIDYFPSYESVVLSERARAWEEDQVHVRPSLIRLNVERMLDAYMPGERAMSEVDVKRRIEEAEEEFSAHNRVGAAELLEPLRHVETMDPESAVRYAEFCLRLHRFDEARAAIDKLPAEAASWRRDLIEARIAIARGEGEKALPILDALAEQYPKAPSILRVRVDALEALERWDDAMLALRKWSDATRNSREPYRRAALLHVARGDYEAAERAFRAALTSGKTKEAEVLDYVDFLVDRKRFAEAAVELGRIEIVNNATLRRVERIKAFLPSTSAS
jgi:Flp pilus assembly protein TadD